MAAENAFSAIVSPIKTDAVVMGAINIPANPAKLELTTKASTTMAETLMPISVAAFRLCATARTALPKRVLRSTKSMQNIIRMLTINTSTSWGTIPAPPMRITSLPKGDGKTIAVGPQIAKAVF